MLVADETGFGGVQVGEGTEIGEGTDTVRTGVVYRSAGETDSCAHVEASFSLSAFTLILNMTMLGPAGGTGHELNRASTVPLSSTIPRISAPVREMTGCPSPLALICFVARSQFSTSLKPQFCILKPQFDEFLI